MSGPTRVLPGGGGVPSPPSLGPPDPMPDLSKVGRDSPDPRKRLRWENDSTDGPHMPFGRHQGRAIRELPGDYLRWLLSLEDLERTPLRAAVLRERGLRRGEDLETAGRTRPAAGRCRHPDCDVPVVGKYEYCNRWCKSKAAKLRAWDRNREKRQRRGRLRKVRQRYTGMSRAEVWKQLSRELGPAEAQAALAEYQEAQEALRSGALRR